MTEAERIQYSKDIGLKLKSIRCSLKITQREASIRINVNRNTITNMENGKGCLSSFVLYSNFLNSEIVILEHNEQKTPSQHNE